MKHIKTIIKLSLIALIIMLPSKVTLAESFININGDSTSTIQLILLFTVLSLLPSIIIMMTSFTRIVIVLSFLRNAMGIQQTPPNQVLIGIAIFLTLFVMGPTIKEINDTAYEPFKNEEITEEAAIDLAKIPIKKFMLKQTKNEDLNVFLELSNKEKPENNIDVDLFTIIPAFVTSELKRAFTMGFLLFIPFLIIDIIVASTLMSMGMIMLPPAIISLPFKLLLFVLVDGWGLLFKTLVSSFNQ